jgi:hypothetical protein
MVRRHLAARPAGNGLTQPDAESCKERSKIISENQPVDAVGSELTQLEPKRQMVRGTGFEPVTFRV